MAFVTYAGLTLALPLPMAALRSVNTSSPNGGHLHIEFKLDKSLLNTFNPHALVEGLGENYSKDPFQICAFSVK